jgi:hypothetical protein
MGHLSIRLECLSPTDTTALVQYNTQDTTGINIGSLVMLELLASANDRMLMLLALKKTTLIKATLLQQNCN